MDGEAGLVIELDTDWEPRDPPVGSVWRVGRRTRLAIGMLTCLLLVAVSARPVAPVPAFRLVESVPASPGDFYSLSGDQVFVVRSTPPARRSRIDAYSLPGGRHQWRALLPAQLYAYPAAATVGVILAEGTNPQQPRQVMALDAATGSVLWRLADAMVFDDTTSVGPRMLVFVAPSGGPRELRLLDTRSGATVWSRPLPAGTRAKVLASRRLVLRSADGSAQILDEDTARTLVSGRLDTDSYQSPLDDSPGFGALSAGDRLIVTYLLPHDVTGVSAYQMSTLDKLWSTEVGERVLNVADCLAVLCVSSDDNMIAVDPATGERRWATLRWIMGGGLGGLVQATNVPGEQDPDGRVVLLDPETGRLTLDLGDWSPLEPIIRGQPALLTTGRRGPLGTWVGALDRAGTAVRPVAFLPDAMRGTCEIDRTGRLYLACSDYDGPVDIWVGRPASDG
ncbi:outer membrane protein assembly factor BamB family protein [Rugosimonospora africana]|uniref:outer membrane protein assembly factor BamB family protein n=1 Tax=Rugosimonospora africana TaxID=556532 RepID=UPI001943DD27|nr:PQQ-binding-like beta-propeller repeat protein [Rugosimonospora africana]